MLSLSCLCHQSEPVLFFFNTLLRSVLFIVVIAFTDLMQKEPPTVGLNVKIMKKRGVTCKVWDIGGQVADYTTYNILSNLSRIRIIWAHHFAPVCTLWLSSQCMFVQLFLSPLRSVTVLSGHDTREVNAVLHCLNLNMEHQSALTTFYLAPSRMTLFQNLCTDVCLGCNVIAFVVDTQCPEHLPVAKKVLLVSYS